MRATFSLSPDDFERIESLRSALAKEGHILNKSEIVRLALLALATSSPAQRNPVLVDLARLKPGRRSAK